MLIWGLVWLACGVLAYGTEKDFIRRFCIGHKSVYDAGWRLWIVFIALCGPFGLLASVGASLLETKTVGLTFRMPKGSR